MSLICQFWKTFALSGTFISSLASLIDLPSIYKFWKGEGDGFQLVFKLSFNEIKCKGMGHSTVFSTFSGSVFFFLNDYSTCQKANRNRAASFDNGIASSNIPRISRGAGANVMVWKFYRNAYSCWSLPPPPQKKN